MADYTEELYEEFAEYRSFFVSSTNAMLDMETEQSDVLIEIRDILKKANNITDDGIKADASGSSIKGAFKNINDLFQNQLKSVFKDFNKFFGDMSGFKDAPSVEFTNFLGDFMKAITMDGEYKDPKELGRLYESLGTGMSLIGDSIMPMSKGLIMFSIASKLKAPEKFIDYVGELLTKDLLKSVDAKKIKKDAEAIEAIAKGVFNFGLYMSLSAPLLLIGIPAAIVAIPVITGMLGLLSLVSKRSKAIKRSAEALKGISLSFLVFSGALAMIGMMGDIDYPKVLGVLGLFTAFVAAITLISKIGGKGDMKSAAISVGILSGALVIFALALPLFEDVSWGTMAKAGASLAFLSLVALVLGSNKGGVIFAGVGMVILTGATYLMALAMQQFRDIEWEDIGKFAATLGVLTAAVYVLGNPMALLGGVIVAGVALAVAGSLYVITEAFDNLIGALDRFKDLGWTESDSVSLKGVFNALLTGVVEPFSSSGVIETLGKVGAGVAGTGMIGIISLALREIVEVLEYYQKSTITDKTATDLGSVISKLVGGVITPFANKSWKSVLKEMAGGVTGASLLVPISLTIREIVEVIEYFKKSKLTVADGEMVGSTVAAVVNAMKQPIIEIGSTTKEYKGTGGEIMTYFSEPAFENGLESLKGLGSVIYDLADAVYKISTLTFVDPSTGQTRTLSVGDFVIAGSNITALVNALKDPIMEIGSTTKEYTGPYGAVATYFSEPAFENGLEALGGLSKVMYNLYEGVKNMATLTFIDPVTGESRTLTTGDFTTAGTNISALVNALKVPIMEIGSTTKEYGGGVFGTVATYFSEPTFVNGMQALGNMSTFLVNVAKAVRLMSEDKYTDADGNVIDMKDKYTSVGEAVENLINSIKNPIMAIGADDGFWSDGDFVNGMESLGKVGEFMKNVSELMATGISDIEGTNLKMAEAINGTIVGFKTSVGELVAVNDEMAKALSTSVKGFNNAINLGLGIGDTDLDEYKERAGIYMSMMNGMEVLADKSDDIEDATDSIIAMNKSTTDLFKILNRTTTSKIDKTKDLFDSLVKLDGYSSDVFEKKLKSVEELIEKTNAIGDNVSDLNKLIKPEASDEMKQMVSLLQSMITQQGQLNTSMQHMSTILAGVLRVENVE